jgi:hypothetical protein
MVIHIDTLPIFDYGPGPNAYAGSLPPQYTTVRGVDVFYALINHELTHWTLFEEFWSQTGYDDNNDCDHDYYPDDWEMGPIRMSYGFEVGLTIITLVCLRRTEPS